MIIEDTMIFTLPKFLHDLSQHNHELQLDKRTHYV